MFMLKIYDNKDNLIRYCSILMFDTNEKTNTFFYKQKPDEQWSSIHYENYSIYDGPYAVIGVRQSEED